MRQFVFSGLPTRVVFGIGAIRQLAAEVERLGAMRVLLVSTPGRAEMVHAISSSLNVAGVFDKAVMHTPLELANEARALNHTYVRIMTFFLNFWRSSRQLDKRYLLRVLRWSNSASTA